MVSKHFYTENGAYCSDPEIKQDIEDISESINKFLIPIYENYRTKGYPAVEITQLISDQMEFGLVRHRLETAAKLAKAEFERKKQMEENKASD